MSRSAVFPSIILLPSCHLASPLPFSPQPTFWEKRDESVKGVGIAQPAVQAENRGAMLGAPGFGSDVAPGYSQPQL